MAFGGNLCRSSCTYMWWTDRWIEKWVGGFHLIQYRLIVLTTRFDSVIVRLVFSAADRAGKFILPNSAHLKPQHLQLTFTFVWLGPQLSYVFVPFDHHPLVLLHSAVSGAADNVGHSVYSRGFLFGQIWCTTAEVGLVITQSYSHNEPPTDDSSTGGKGKYLQPQSGVEILREARNTI